MVVAVVDEGEEKLVLPVVGTISGALGPRVVKYEQIAPLHLFEQRAFVVPPLIPQGFEQFRQQVESGLAPIFQRVYPHRDRKVCLAAPYGTAEDKPHVLLRAFFGGSFGLQELRARLSGDAEALEGVALPLGGNAALVEVHALLHLFGVAVQLVAWARPDHKIAEAVAVVFLADL